MTKPKPEDAPPPWVATIWVWGKQRWPIIAMLVGLALGTAAFVVGGNLIAQLRTTQREGRQLVCAISKTVTANPIRRIPELQTQEEFQRSVAALKLIIVQSRNLDCDALLGPVIEEQQKAAQEKQQGGGAHKPQVTGSQLAGG